jgi:hypothetical protein
MILSSNWLALKSKGAADPMKRKRLNIEETKEVIKLPKVSNPQFIAMDCEMVEGESIEHMLARVSLVDFEGRAVYDAYVRPREPVIDYRTGITGLTKDKIFAHSPENSMTQFSVTFVISFNRFAENRIFKLSVDVEFPKKLRQQ